MKIGNLAMNFFHTAPSKNSFDQENVQGFIGIFKEMLQSNMLSNSKGNPKFAELDLLDEQGILTQEELLLLGFESLLVNLEQANELDELDEENMAFLMNIIPLINQMSIYAEIKEMAAIEKKLNIIEQGIFCKENLIVNEQDSNNVQILFSNKQELVDKIQSMLESLKEDKEIIKQMDLKHLPSKEEVFFENKNHFNYKRESVALKPISDNLLFYGRKNLTSQGKGEITEEVFANQLDINALQKSSVLATADEEVNVSNILKTVTENLKDNIVILKNGEITTTKLKLYPEELGEVNVQLELVKGQLNVRIIAASEQAFNHLQQQGKDLQDRFTNDSFSEVNIEFLMDSDTQEKENSQYKGLNQGSKRHAKDIPNEEEYVELVQSAYNYKV